MNNVWQIIGHGNPGTWNLSAYYDSVTNKYPSNVPESEIARHAMNPQHHILP